jgi:26S proteasome regulatory subunit N7
MYLADEMELARFLSATHRELSRFIAAGRLHASIDKVNGIVETTRPSRKNAQYETVVKKGDVLLASVQRLSKVLY